MKAISLTASPRTLTKTRGSKRVRLGGGLPGVVYGNGEPQSVELEAQKFDQAIKSTEAKNFLVELDIEGNKSIAIVQDIQRNPLTNITIHVDFKRLTNESVVTADVPLRPIGTSEGVKQGGVLQTPFHTITLKGRPADIPEILEPDISALEVGQSLYLEDLTLPENVILIGPPKTMIFSVATSRLQMMAAAEAAAAEETAATSGQGGGSKEESGGATDGDGDKKED